jgi:lysozyme family protein
MPITLSEALVFTLKWEGGFFNHPLDPGGPTNFGIIQSRYDQYRTSKKLPRRSVRDITVAEYTEIYDVYYWEPVRAKWLDGTLGLALFDTAVNMGVGGAIRRLQMSLEVPLTGKWTQAISDVIHESDQLEVALNICKLRIAKRYDRIRERPDQKVFLRGWLNRDNDLMRKVKSMGGMSVRSFEEDDELDFDPEEIYNSFAPDVLQELDRLDDLQGDGNLF